MSWRAICATYLNQYNLQSVSGNRDAHSFLSRRAHLLTTFKIVDFEKWWSCALRGGCGSCGSLWTMPHTCSLLSLSTQLSQPQPPCDCLVGYGLYPILRQLPAKICHRQFYRRYGQLHAAHFLFAKKKQKRKEDIYYWQYTILKRR